MFRGISAINMDAKGRVALPARYRDDLASSLPLVVTIDTAEPCLLLYPVSEWEIIEQKLKQLPSFNRASRRIQRLLLGHATELELDGHGRVLLPALLRDYASLDKRIILVGQGNKFELWDEEHWHHGRETWLAEEAEANGDLPDEFRDLSL